MASGARNPSRISSCFDRLRERAGGASADRPGEGAGGRAAWGATTMNGDQSGGSDGAEGGSASRPGLERQAIGGYLRRQRELRGISAEELARTTRIPLRSLERLESGSFDDEVDGFVRGFVRTVAGALGLDPDETVSRMLEEPTAEDVPGYRAATGLPRALLGLALAMVLALAIGLVRFAASGQPAVGSADAEDVVYRLDPVRALAETQLGVEGGLPAPVASPPPEDAVQAAR